MRRKLTGWKKFETPLPDAAWQTVGGKGANFLNQSGTFFKEKTELVYSLQGDYLSSFLSVLHCTNGR